MDFSNKLRLALPLALFISLVGLSGCGKKTGTVSGKVSYENRPLAFGIVIFAGSDNQPITANIESDGTYVAKGIPFGAVRVAVNSPRPRQNFVLPEKKGMTDKMKEIFKDGAKGRPVGPGSADPSKWIEIPEKYAIHESSGITFTLGEKIFAYDINLKAQ